MASKSTAPAETRTATPCLCGAYEIEIWDGREIPEGADPGDFVRYEDTGCAASTTRDFAPGHDAKLKALLIRAGMAGHAVRRNSGGVANIGTAEQQAASFPFAYMVLNGIKRGQERAAAKAKKPVHKAPRARKAKAPASFAAKIKVGRWTYDATIDAATKTAIYTDGKGKSHSKNEGQYTIVDAK